MNVKENKRAVVEGKANLVKKKGKFEIIQVGKIWAVKNNSPKKIVLYTEKKTDAAKVVKDLEAGVMR